MKLRGSTNKYILRESMRGVLPEEILSRPKMGFPVPVGAWFRGAFREVIDEYVLSERAASRGVFESPFLCDRWSGDIRSLEKTIRSDSGRWSILRFGNDSSWTARSLATAKNRSSNLRMHEFHLTNRE
jgi:asparagine synthetase B (glutamine-hydrolysing)